MALFRRKKKVEAPVVEEVAPTLPPAPEPDERGLRSMTDHRDYLLSLVEPLPPFGMQLIDAQDLAICEDIVAPADLPRTAIAQLAGYAVRASDVHGASQDEPLTLAVRTVAADAELPTGCAVKVEEHAQVPAGADAVLPPEFTDRGEQQVKVFEGVRAGEHVQAQGADVADESVLVSSGEVLDPRKAGLLAAMGIDKVLARPRPRVVVVSAGVSLVEPGRRLTEPGQVHDANGSMLAAAAKADGAQVFRVGVMSNDLDELRETISDQLIRADLIISTGGVADGGNDAIRQVMPQLGLTDFAELSMRPGRRQGFGLIGPDEVPMVMLPAHPLSAYVSYVAFVRPLLRKLMGVEPHVDAPVRAITPRVLRSPAGYTTVMPAVVSDEGGRHRVDVLADAESRQLSALAGCNALAVIDPDTELVRGGEPVWCWLVDAH